MLTCSLKISHSTNYPKMVGLELQEISLCEIYDCSIYTVLVSGNGGVLNFHSTTILNINGDFQAGGKRWLENRH
jgi:hypothetical protein